MQTFLHIAALIFLGMFLTSCSSSDSNSQNTNQSAGANNLVENSNSVRDNFQDLGMVINLPFEPEDAVWRVEKQGKPDENGKLPSAGATKLTAVLQFKPEDAEKITAQAQAFNQPVPAAINAETWFPAELIAQSQISGDETIKGTTYAANDFFQTPYSDGKITRAQDSNYFILEMYSK